MSAQYSNEFGDGSVASSVRSNPKTASVASGSKAGSVASRGSVKSSAGSVKSGSAGSVPHTASTRSSKPSVLSSAKGSIAPSLLSDESEYTAVTSASGHVSAVGSGDHVGSQYSDEFEGNGGASAVASTSEGGVDEYASSYSEVASVPAQEPSGVQSSVAESQYTDEFAEPQTSAGGSYSEVEGSGDDVDDVVDDGDVPDAAGYNSSVVDDVASGEVGSGGGSQGNVGAMPSDSIASAYSDAEFANGSGGGGSVGSEVVDDYDD